MAVAAAAPVLVSTGPADKPIRLGDKQPWSAENTLHVWDWSKGDQSRPLKATATGSFAVSPDGKWAVTADGQAVDLTTGEAKPIPNFPADVHGICFSPKGDAVLLQIGSYTGPAGKDGAIARVLDFPAGTTRSEAAGQWAYTFACAFTPDGGQFLMMDKGRTLRRYDTKTGNELAHYEPAFENSIRAIAVSPDGKRVAAAGTRGDLYVWDLAGGKPLHKLTGKSVPLADLTVLTGMRSLAFSPDGRQLAAGAVQATVLWDVETGKVAHVLPKFQSGSATDVRFSDDGKKLTSVREFVGTAGPAGEDLLVYPTVHEWDLERDGRVPKG
jgi:WD40 repeat protein